ncbi:MAG: iron-containing alcohol dehydrogenase family protein [Desulfotomaculales bacterium]
MLFDILLPGRILFGPGSTYRLGEEAGRLGHRGLMVTGKKSLKETGNFERVTRPLTDARIELVFYSEVEPEPTVDTVEEVRALLRESGCTFVVGVGGGSVLDVAKAAAGLVGEDEPVQAYFEKPVTRPGLPWIAVPTTAGSGSEATINAVLIDRGTGRKQSIRCEFWHPAVAIVDPILTMSMSRRLTAATGMDALTHAIEAFTSRWSNALTQALAREAVTLICRYFYTAWKVGRLREARENMMLGSLLAGMALNNARAGIVHALAHPLGVRLGQDHGTICAVLLPAAMHFNRPLCEDCYAELAHAAGIVPRAVSTEEAASKLIFFVENLLSKLELPISLGSLGLREEDIPGVVNDALPSGSLAANPRKATREDLGGILRRLL